MALISRGWRPVPPVGPGASLCCRRDYGGSAKTSSPSPEVLKPLFRCQPQPPFAAGPEPCPLLLLSRGSTRSIFSETRQPRTHKSLRDFRMEPLPPVQRRKAPAQPEESTQYTGAVRRPWCGVVNQERTLVLWYCRSLFAHRQRVRTETSEQLRISNAPEAPIGLYAADWDLRAASVYYVSYDSCRSPFFCGTRSNAHTSDDHQLRPREFAHGLGRLVIAQSLLKVLSFPAGAPTSS